MGCRKAFQKHGIPAVAWLHPGTKTNALEINMIIRFDRIITAPVASGLSRCLDGSTMNLNSQKPFGYSGILLGPLGFGGNVLGNLYAPVDEQLALDTVCEAYATGVRYFDTAPLYGHGLSEHRTGHVLRRYPRDNFILSSKVGRLLRPHGKVPPPRLLPSQGGIFAGELPFSPVFDYSYDGVLRSFEDSAQRLGMNRIDILLIHDVDEWTHKQEYGARLKQVETETVPALERLKSEGAIRAYGAGVNQAEACEDLMERGAFDGFLLAGRYTLLEQGGLDGLLPKCQERGISIILGAPYNSGILVTGAVPEARVTTTCQRPNLCFGALRRSSGSVSNSASR